jgi:hypothetical protein
MDTVGTTPLVTVTVAVTGGGSSERRRLPVSGGDGMSPSVAPAPAVTPEA